jgi:transposase-like protein
MRKTRFADLHGEWSEEDARLALEEWRRSGTSIAAFARERGISAPRLYWWRKRLAVNWSRAEPVLSLVPATVLSTDAAIVIRVPGGLAIEVANASPNWIATVVAELTRSLP